jgi:sugar phosphate isomerase/epimerase
MKLGYPTHPRKPLLPEISWIADQGFEFVDLFFEPDACDYHQIDVGAVRRLLTDRHLDCVGHTPWYLPIGSPQRDLRQAAVTTTGKYLNTFAETGCKRVTLHASWPSSMFTAAEGVEFQCESLQQITAMADPLGITILFEPVGVFQETVENLKRILTQVPQLAFHLDIGHFNLNHRSPAQTAETFADRLQHVHLHDNDGNRDLHLPMGTGNIDWADLVRRLKKVYDGTITLEIFSTDRDYVLLSRKKLLELWNRA